MRTPSEILHSLKGLRDEAIEASKVRYRFTEAATDRARRERHRDRAAVLTEAIRLIESATAPCPQPRQECDEYYCPGCGIRWDVHETKPPCMRHR